MKRVRVKSEEDGGSYFAKPKTNLKFIPTGSKVFDLALGGGWAEGRVANVVGDKSTGKTLLCIEASANFIRKYPKGKVYYRECESAFDKLYAAQLGMPLKNVDFGKEQWRTVQHMYRETKKIIAENKGPALLIVDSLDALSDTDELERDIDQGSYGAEKAKKMSQYFRQLVNDLEDKDITLIIVSQVRDKIGISFGRKTTRSGGKALDFYASQVAYLAHLGTISKTASNTKRPIGVEIRAKLDKNKVSLPFREAQFPILFGWGIDDVTSCLNFLSETGNLKKVGVKKEGIKKFVIDLMRADPKTYREEMADIHKAVETTWYAIEKSILPTRTKYGE